MSRQVNLYEAKTQLSQLVEDAARGDEIVIAKNGKAMARLTSAHPERASRRAFGQWQQLLSPEELATFRSHEWWRQWKKLDAEIERDFEGPRASGAAAEKEKWRDTSSTPTLLSGSKRTRRRSAAKRSRN